ncbi:MAG: hypothetical protein Q7K38_00365 [Candidatus Wildermuthbacteria bacterium]|nr:hypothetical protein [Candidatus Wildermuthbacteria bacterium]
MATKHERQSVYASVVQKIREAKSAEDLCGVARILLALVIPEDSRRRIHNAFEQRVSDLGLWRGAPEDIEHARAVLRGEASTPETPNQVP